LLISYTLIEQIDYVETEFERSGSAKGSKVTAGRAVVSAKSEASLDRPKATFR
jgi:hypothetical protein